MARRLRQLLDNLAVGGEELQHRRAVGSYLDRDARPSLRVRECQFRRSIIVGAQIDSRLGTRMRLEKGLIGSFLLRLWKIANAFIELHQIFDVPGGLVIDPDVTALLRRVVLARLEYERLVLIVVVEAEVPEARYLSVLVLASPEDQPAVLGTFVVHEDHARNLAIRTSVDASLNG